MLSIFKSLRREKAARRTVVPTSDLFHIDLGPVEEPMRNGHVERISLGTLATSERISLGKAKRASVAPPIGRAAERDFDWKSVQPPDQWRDQQVDAAIDAAYDAPAAFDLDQPHEDDRYRHNGYHAEPPAAPAYAPTPPSSANRSAPRRATHELADVHAESGALTIHGVQKSFGSRMVVRGVSLSLRRGEAVGLLGPNGAGKTTVFYMITGLIKADAGKIQFDGHDITHLPMYQRARLGIGYLPQEASIFRGLNVEDNIRAVLEVVEPNKKKREAELDQLLDEFNIARLRKTPSIALSGGERRRTEIARALATRPAYMLLDEPFAGIDPIAVGDIQNLVHHLKQRGIGVLITDHNVRETLGLTDRAYIIYSGEVLREGRADDIINDPEVRRLYLGEEFRM